MTVPSIVRLNYWPSYEEELFVGTYVINLFINAEYESPLVILSLFWISVYQEKLP